MTPNTHKAHEQAILFERELIFVEVHRYFKLYTQLTTERHTHIETTNIPKYIDSNGTNIEVL